jgi:RNA polymerase sigma-70 factor (ECF subfamily)
MPVNPLELAIPTAVSAARADVEDDDLVSRLRRGERMAIGEAYAAHHAAVRAFARRLVGDEAAAEDIVHDVFVRLPDAVARFRGESALRSFLIGVAANRARHHIRGAMRRRRAMERLAEHGHDAGTAAAAGASANPGQVAMRRRLADRLSAALDELPLDQRVAFVLCEVEQRTAVEAAEILEVPDGTVRSRLFHARKRLRELLAAEVRDE